MDWTTHNCKPLRKTIYELQVIQKRRLSITKEGIGQRQPPTTSDINHPHLVHLTHTTMPSLLLYAATALITYIAYSQLLALIQTVVRKVPPVASNSWWALLRGKSVPGGVLIEQFYEKVR